MPRIPAHIPKKNVIGLAYEPIFYLGLTEQFIEYAKANIGTYYIGDKGVLQTLLQNIMHICGI